MEAQIEGTDSQNKETLAQYLGNFTPVLLSSLRSLWAIKIATITTTCI